jgi:glycosyltransferase involved in cell wall biosynthesis
MSSPSNVEAAIRLLRVGLRRTTLRDAKKAAGGASVDDAPAPFTGVLMSGSSASAPKISVYVVCRNHRRYVEQAIESVLRQSSDDWELLIFDDGSTDGSWEVISLYVGDPRVRIFAAGGIGLPAVCNYALREARGEYLVRLDGDDHFDENILLVLGNHLDRHLDMALVFPDYYLTDEFGNITSREWRAKLYESNHTLDSPPNGACTMIRRAVLEEMGGYREDLGAQDGLDLWVKVRDRYKSGNVNLPLFYYRRHEANLTGNIHRIANARRRIKRDAVADRIAEYGPITAIVPCRRNYDFLPDLWRAEVGGRMLLRRSLALLTACDLVDRIVVACDNPEAETVVRGFGDPRCEFFLREPASTLRTHSLAPVVDRIIGAAGGMSVIHYVQAPFISSETIAEAISTLMFNDADCCFGVEEIGGAIYRRTAHGLQQINQAGGIASDLSAIYRDSQTVVALHNRNLGYGSLLGPRVVHFAAAPEETFFIDSAIKLKTAGLMAETFNWADGL